MKFQKAPNLWAKDVDLDTLKLQPGNWVWCGFANDHAARWVGRTEGGTVLVAHWQGSAKATMERFETLKGALTLNTLAEAA